MGLAAPVEWSFQVRLRRAIPAQQKARWTLAGLLALQGWFGAQQPRCFQAGSVGASFGG